jgi:hypothetical protein
MQQDWLNYDRASKQQVIDSLSKEDYDKLIIRLEESPELQKLLDLEVVEE